MFIGRWEFWPDTVMCIVFGVFIVGWVVFVWNIPWFSKKYDQRKKAKREKLRVAFAQQVERNKQFYFREYAKRYPHRHKMVIDGFSENDIHWSCVRDCPTKFGVYWNRKDFRNKTLNFPHSPSRGYTVIPINSFAVRGIPGSNPFHGFGVNEPR